MELKKIFPTLFIEHLCLRADKTTPKTTIIRGINFYTQKKQTLKTEPMLIFTPILCKLFLVSYFNHTFNKKYFYQIMQKILDYIILKSQNSFENYNRHKESGANKMVM